jgi:hypothetical protein
VHQRGVLYPAFPFIMLSLLLSLFPSNFCPIIQLKRILPVVHIMSSRSLENGTYSASQVDNYLSRIAFPVDRAPKIATASAQTPEGLEYLTKLQKSHLISITFENISLHYNKFPGVSLDKEDLFDKIVVRRRGGYCMEQNILFASILRTLGYEVIQSGARVFSSSGELGGW